MQTLEISRGQMGAPDLRFLPDRIAITGEDPASLNADCLAIATGTPVENSEAVREIDRRLGGLISQVTESGEHAGHLHDRLIIPTVGLITAPRLLLFGTGKPEELDGQRLRFAYNNMVRAAREHGYRRLAVLCASPVHAEGLAAVIEGCLMGTWDRRSRATDALARGVEELVLAGFGPAHERDAMVAAQLGAATALTRDWQTMPANELGPAELEAAAREIAARHQGTSVEVVEGESLDQQGYRLIRAVGRGSQRAPRLIGLHHHKGDGNGPHLALIGKGITFDSGGLSLKSEERMLTMHNDMAGAAAVLAAFDVIAANRLPIDVTAVVAAAENLPSGNAQRPGDVWRSAAGKTVEVLSTDAEGRLVLADALTFAIRRGATHLLDLATLTSAAREVTGHVATPAVSNDEAFWLKVTQAAQLSGDRVWRLPMYPEHHRLLASDVADLRNGFYGEAGATTAAAFVCEFAEGNPWVHLDISFSSWNRNPDLSDLPAGALGTGTRLCFRLAELLAAPGS